MVKNLYLLRHGKSDWAKQADDFHRPLKNRGKRGAQKIGLWLAKHNEIPDHVISSSAVRAVATADKACKVMGFDCKHIERLDRVYMASPDELIAVINTVPENIKRLLIVGHNPGLEQLLILLAAQKVKIPADGKVLPTATLAILTYEGLWNDIGANKLQLREIIRSRELPSQFPFP